MIEEAQKPITSEYLDKYNKEILLPEISLMLDEKLKRTKDEILTSDDKLSKKLDKILKEQAAHTKSYQRLEKRIEYLEAVVKVLGDKTGIPVKLDNPLEE